MMLNKNNFKQKPLVNLHSRTVMEQTIPAEMGEPTE